MITINVVSKLVSARNDTELDTVISKMSEADSKAVLKIIISKMNKERIDGLKLHGFITEKNTY